MQRHSSRGERVRLELPDGWLAGIQRFSRSLGLTPFMTLLAAFQAMLARYCGQEDIVVGTPIAGRMRIESEEAGRLAGQHAGPAQPGAPDPELP